MTTTPQRGRRPVTDPPDGPSAGIDALIDATRQENARADTKSAALLTVVGIGFTAFSVAGASAVTVPVHGVARWLCVAALAGVCAVAELLLLVLRPVLGTGDVGQRYFAAWRHYASAPERLARELCVDEEACRTLIRLSGIAWRKYRLVRTAVDLMIGVLPLMAVALSVTLLTRR
jgi:hypothetical protein